MVEFYPKNSEVLCALLDGLMSSDFKVEGKVHGLIVPHAAYGLSGGVAGRAFALLKKEKWDKVVILGPSHNVGCHGIMALDSIETPLGDVKIVKNNYGKLKKEHSIKNQIPFLQSLDGDLEVLPLAVGQLEFDEAREIAEQFAGDTTSLFIFSTNLSHYLHYNEAVKEDKKTVKMIENLDFDRFGEVEACGIYPLLIMYHLCKMNKWKPKLVEYKNSGDVTNIKKKVVGYAGFWF